jgi:hypothetical protein
VSAVVPAPDFEGALTAAGVLCHFVAADPAAAEAFRVWVEHCPGDLETETVVAYLAAVHDLLVPDCDVPAAVDLPGWRRIPWEREKPT